MSSNTNLDSSQEGEGYAGTLDLVWCLGRLVRSQKWVLFVLAAALLCAEVGLRLAFPQLAGLVYAPGVTGGHPITVTADSFRIPIGDVPGTTFDILAIGDSTTFGTGVSAEQTWPLRLSSYLGEGVDVRNAGIEGGEPRQLLLGLRNGWASPMPPKFIVLLVTGNMVSFTQFRKDQPAPSPQVRADAFQNAVQKAPKNLKRRVVETFQSSALWKAISINIETGKYALGLQNHRVDVSAPLSPLLAYGWQQPDLPKDFVLTMWAEFEAALQDLASEAKRLDSCLILGFLPPRFTLSEQSLDNRKFVPKTRLTLDAEAKIASFAKQLDLPFIPVGQSLRDARGTHGPLKRPLYIPGDYTHLDADGHDLVAQTNAVILNSILSNQKSCAN